MALPHHQKWAETARALWQESFFSSAAKFSWEMSTSLFPHFLNLDCPRTYLTLPSPRLQFYPCHGPAYDHYPVGPAQAGPPPGTKKF